MTPPATNPPTPATHHVAQVIGPAAWALLQQHFGGSELRVPKTRNSKVWRDIMACIGAPAADRLIAHYGGDRIPVPLGAHLSRSQRIARIHQLKDQGMTPDHIALSYREERRLCSRTVKRMLALPDSGTDSGASLPLFGGAEGQV